MKIIIVIFSVQKSYCKNPGPKPNPGPTPVLIYPTCNIKNIVGILKNKKK